MADLLELAARCEAAEGPDCDLDHAIHDLLGDNDGAPLYTRSLDAAMTLVPEGWPSLTIMRTDDLRCLAQLAGNDDHMMCEDPDEFYVEAEGASPALALCAAALRARSAQP